MRKKLNKKLKIALATLGAFAVCGVSAYSVLDELNHEPIESLALDVTNDGSVNEVGLWSFWLNTSMQVWHFSMPSLTISEVGVSFTGFNLRFYNAGGSITFSTSDYSLSYSGSGSLVISAIDDGSLSNASNATILATTSVSLRFQSSNGVYLSNEIPFDVNVFTSVVSGDSVVLTPVYPSPTPSDYVHEIVSILTAGIVNLGTGIGQGVSSFVQSLAFNSAGDGLSVYFVMVVVFGGIALAVGLTSKIFMWLSNLGS